MSIQKVILDINYRETYFFTNNDEIFDLAIFDVYIIYYIIIINIL